MAPERSLSGFVRPPPLAGTRLSRRHFPGSNHPIRQDLTTSWFPHFVFSGLGTLIQNHAVIVHGIHDPLQSEKHRLLVSKRVNNNLLPTLLYVADVIDYESLDDPVS